MKENGFIGPQEVALLEDVAFLKEVCHWGQDLRSQMLKPGPVSLSLLVALPSDPDAELSANSLTSCLSVFCYASGHDNNVLNS